MQEDRLRRNKIRSDGIEEQENEKLAGKRFSVRLPKSNKRTMQEHIMF